MSCHFVWHHRVGSGRVGRVGRSFHFIPLHRSFTFEVGDSELDLVVDIGASTGTGRDAGCSRRFSQRRRWESYSSYYPGHQRTVKAVALEGRSQNIRPSDD